ncbi:hypothetical protein, partial [Paenibacillus odorifer]
SLRVCGGCKVELESLDSLFRESRLFLCVVGMGGERENGGESGRAEERKSGRAEGSKNELAKR